MLQGLIQMNLMSILTCCAISSVLFYSIKQISSKIFEKLLVRAGIERRDEYYMFYGRRMAFQRVFYQSDRRQIHIVLTEKARTLSGEYDKVSPKTNEIFYVRFSDDEIVVFEDTLRQVLLNLNEKEHMI